MGGNVQIENMEAGRIDLKKHDRTSVATALYASLSAMNRTFSEFSGIPLWSDELFKSREFLSGSSSHFFDTDISDDEFVCHKPTVGDIDVQVDCDKRQKIKEWFDSLNGDLQGHMSFIGHKSSTDQIITLWHLRHFDICVQVDFEMVEYKDGKPAPWSKFSRSSNWDDVKRGVKGVFHKYLMRAITAKDIQQIVLLKGKKGIPTQIMAGEYSFSVAYGLRKKFEKTKLPGVYKEVPVKESYYEKDISKIFKTLFSHEGTKDTLRMFESFVGTTKLVKRYCTAKQIDNIIKGFSILLWGKGAQGLVRVDGDEDYKIKKAAFVVLLKELRKEEYPLGEMVEKYYMNYR